MTVGFYQHRESSVHRLNPLTKLTLAVAVVIAAFAVPLTWWPAALFLVVLVPAVLAARVPARFAALTVKFVGPLLVAVFLVQGLFFPGEGAELARLGPISVKAEGLAFAAQTATRLLVLIGAFLFLLLTTHPGVLMNAMVQRGLPPNISYVVSATLQIVPAFRERAQHILRAQQARGMATGGGLRRRIGVLLPLIGPLALGALTEVEERAVAMEARAFGATGRRTSLMPVPDTTAQRLARWGLAAFAAATIVANALGVFA
ncbi:energy-coupling factor transporter transmembrane component T family protein [Gandjariella thermophila]|uniref:ABC transporter permease n=1 Tax=Gandjariella thermophila TaxID=1931992 RepID=A0A4D4JEU6_9PSEU|nr:energy-coupling factor transporter transmembrane component T [Gandjariella thermophila]GDY32886.1 ABC transporter permease [Gandjariella thermophila]